jgi:DNA-binding NtrC family response regulator
VRVLKESNSMEERESILIVDDQPNWREVLSSLLEEKYDVTSVGSYQEALHFLLERRTPFALAIIDIRLNELDIANEEGLRLLRTLRGLAAPTNVIVLTGYSSIRTAREALRDLGVVDYIDKGMFGHNIADFQETVNRAVKAFAEHREESQMQRSS